MTLAQTALAPDKAAQLRNGVLVLAPLAAIALALFARWIALLKVRGGGVSTERFGVPDLIVTFLLGQCALLAAYVQFTAAKPMAFSLEVLMANSRFEIILLLLLAGFLYLRRIEVARFLGLRLSSPVKLIGWAVLFLVCAYPIVAFLGALMAGRSHDAAEQGIVSYFRERAQSGDSRGLVAVSLTAVVVAPLFEEFFFRGYFYPTLKRYIGPVAASIVVSALFACIHGNIAALPPLFALALCLTIAYEWTGSLFVPMLMHALFNSMNLLIMYVSAVKPPPTALMP